MSPETFGRSSVLASLLVGRRGAVLVVASTLALALVGCHKAPPHRAKRVHAHPTPAETGAVVDDDSPSPAPAPAAAVAPAPPPAPRPPAPPAAAAAPLHHQFTVDRTAPSRPRPPGHAPVPDPAPEAAPAPEYKAVDDQPPPSPAPSPSSSSASGSRCEGGSAGGERLSVQGVAANDVLNVRQSPDKTSAVLGSLPPDATGVRGTPNRRRIGPSTWRQVECGPLRGWVNERFLARETGQ